MNDVLKKDMRLHPHETSLVHSKREAVAFLDAGGFDLESYEFGPRDFFVQAVVVGSRRPSRTVGSRATHSASA
jgi:hypothetical protein